MTIEHDNDKIMKTEFSDEMSKSYLDYAMSVIVSRAIPDVKDGLKPVQRRTLFAMHELGIKHDKPHRKCARIVGDTMGKYHPHGDSSIYDALVVMAQDWKKGEILVDGHGNFGSIEGDGAAAARYTEARLSRLSEEAYLADLDKNVVDYMPNFDETEQEPVVLPVRIPNILVNGADGIAVGMKTSIPTHNLKEVLTGVKALVENPEMTTDELMAYIPGPDFPTGGIVINQSELKDIYESGTGKLKLRGKIELEPAKRKSGRPCLVVSEIPYTMIGQGISKFIMDVANLIESKKLPEVTDISNQSSKEGIRIVFELKNGADPERVKNIFYKKTGLEDTFGVNMLVVSDGRPETLGLKAVLQQNILFQKELNTRKYENLLKKAEDKSEIEEGLIKAIDIIDLIIEIIRGSKTVKDAKACLMGDPSNVTLKSKESERLAAALSFTERQAAAILEMRLSKLIGLEILTLQQEHGDTVKKIQRYTRILKSPAAMREVIKKDLDYYIEAFGRPRRTLLTNAEAAVEVKEQIVEQDVIFAMDRFGYVKTYDSAVYNRNQESIMSENTTIFMVKNTGKIILFTNTGHMHQIKVMDIPQIRVKDKGIPVDNICNYKSKEESLVGIMSEEALNEDKLVFVTKKGMVKVVLGAEFIVSKRTISATKLTDGDELLAVMALTGSQIILQSEGGYHLRFPVDEISQMKKTSIGVKGIAMEAEDRLKLACLITPRDPEVSKLFDLNKIKLGKRAGKGIKPRQ